MQYARSFMAVLLMSLVVLACSLSTPTETIPQTGVNITSVSNTEPAAATFTPIVFGTLQPTESTEKLQLEVVQSQLWTDNAGQVRVNVLLRNPYDFPVERERNASAELLNSAGI